MFKTLRALSRAIENVRIPYTWFLNFCHSILFSISAKVAPDGLNRDTSCRYSYFEFILCHKKHEVCYQRTNTPRLWGHYLFPAGERASCRQLPRYIIWQDNRAATIRELSPCWKLILVRGYSQDQIRNPNIETRNNFKIRIPNDQNVFGIDAISI